MIGLGRHGVRLAFAGTSSADVAGTTSASAVRRDPGPRLPQRSGVRDRMGTARPASAGLQHDLPWIGISCAVIGKPAVERIASVGAWSLGSPGDRRAFAAGAARRSMAPGFGRLDDPDNYLALARSLAEGRGLRARTAGRRPTGRRSIRSCWRRWSRPLGGRLAWGVAALAPGAGGGDGRAARRSRRGAGGCRRRGPDRGGDRGAATRSWSRRAGW